MNLKNPVTLGPVVFCTTEHLSQYGLPSESQREAVKRLLENCKTFRGSKLKALGCILLPTTDYDALVRDQIPRMCRDAISLCHVTQTLYGGNPTAPGLFASDYFEIAPLFLAEDGRIEVHSPNLSSVGTSARDQDVELRLPTHLPRVAPDWGPDEQLRDCLDSAVRKLVAGKHAKVLRQVFRALNIALHASRALVEQESNWHDLGTRIVQWISAFETLVHPGRGEVYFCHVYDRIGTIQWNDLPFSEDGRAIDPPLCIGRKRFKHRFKDRKTKQPAQLMENAAQHYYRQLYNLRNAFAHGNHLKQSNLRVLGRPNGWPVHVPIPLLFREVVLERLRELGIVTDRRPFTGAGDAYGTLTRMLLRPTSESDGA